MSTGFSWSENPKDVFIQGFLEYKANIEKELDALVQKYAPQIENWMKANAPWNDRTGHARQSLKAEIEYEVNEISIYLYYNGIDYDKYLEYAFVGKYSILSPALDYWSPILFKAVKELMS